MTDDSDDPFDFVFDKSVRDIGNSIRLDVTVTGPDDDAVQFNLSSGTLRIPFFLSPHHARLLAQYVLQACDAREAAGGETAETD